LNWTIALLLTASAAFASTTTTIAGLEDRLRALNRSIAEPILVGAAGPEVEKVLEKMQHAGPVLPVQVVRVPTMGDAAAEMQRALASAGLRCGLRVTTAHGGGLGVETFGDCRSAADFAASPQPPAPTAPAPAPPVAPPSQAVPRPTPEPPPEVASAPSLGLDRGDLLYVGRAWAKAPDPAVALLESTLLGFGTGHFYAGNAEEGKIHLGIQAGGLVLSGLGTLLSVQARSSGGATFGMVLTSAGSAAFTIDRVVDIYRAPLSARDERTRLMGGR
jgi:hypothetical protein